MAADELYGFSKTEADRIMRAVDAFERITRPMPFTPRRTRTGDELVVAIWDGDRDGKVYRGHIVGPDGAAQTDSPVQWKFPNDEGGSDAIVADSFVILRPIPVHEESETDWGEVEEHGPRMWAWEARTGIEAFWGVAVSEDLSNGLVYVRRASGYPWALTIIDAGSELIEVFVGVDSFVRGQTDGLQGDPVYCLQNLDPNVLCSWVGIAFFCGANWEYPTLANLSATQDAPTLRGA